MDADELVGGAIKQVYVPFSLTDGYYLRGGNTKTRAKYEEWFKYIHLNEKLESWFYQYYLFANVYFSLMDDSDLIEDGRFKMNPPLRDKTDREALLTGIKDGTIDMISTDHAPHSAEEKARGLEKSAFGIVGIETAFPVLYTKLVKTGFITMDRLMELLVFNARERFNIPLKKNDYTIWDLDKEFTVDSADFLSMGKATPFEGWKLNGVCLMTVKDGVKVYSI